MTAPPTRPEQAAWPAQVTIMFVLVLLVLIGCAGLAVDAVAAWRLSQGQSDTLTGARETIMTSQEAIKYGIETPEGTLDTVETVQAVLKDYLEEANVGRYSTNTKLTVYELPKAQTGPADRYIGVLIECEATYTPSFASTVGVGPMPIKSRECFVVHPYAGREVWRPSDDEDSLISTYRWDASTSSIDSTIDSRSLSWESLDGDLKKALEAAAGIQPARPCA